MFDRQGGCGGVESNHFRPFHDTPETMSSKSTMKQSKLSFGASKPTAAANKAKKEVSEPSTSTSKRSTRSSTSKTSEVTADSSKDINVDDIEVGEDTPSSESEKEKDDVEEFPEEKRESEKAQSTVVKRETRASKAKAKAEEAVPPAKVLAVPAKSGKKESVVEKNEVVEDVESRPKLNIKNRAYNDISHDTKVRRGFAHTIHPTTEVDGKDVPLNRVDEILRLFDMSYEYGPCVGMTRLERWKRASKLGLNPPPEIYDILMTKEGLTEPRYAQNVLYGRV